MLTIAPFVFQVFITSDLENDVFRRKVLCVCMRAWVRRVGGWVCVYICACMCSRALCDYNDGFR